MKVADGNNSRIGRIDLTPIYNQSQTNKQEETMEKLKKITAILLVTMAIVTTMVATVHDYAVAERPVYCDGYTSDICYIVIVEYPDKTFTFVFRYRDWVLA